MEQPTHIADSGCTKHCLGTKVGMRNFQRRDIRVLLGDNGSSYMMARGVGDIGILKGALFVPGLMKDLISTGQLDRDGMAQSTEQGVKRIWAGPIHRSEVLMRFNMQSDKFYHWTEPYEELHNQRVSRGEFMHTTTEMSSVGEEGKTRDEVREVSDARLKIRQKIRELAGSRTGQNQESSPESDPKLVQLVRREVKRFLRGSKGVRSAAGTTGMNRMQLLHCRLGHIGQAALLRLLKYGAVKGLGTTYEECKDEVLGMCDSCMQGKCNAEHIPSSETAAETKLGPFESMYMDIKHMSGYSVQGNLYSTYIIDKGTGKHYVYHTVDKTDQHEIIKRFVMEEVLPSGLPMVRKWTADSDANFLDVRFQELVQLIGSRMEYSPPHVHQVNGVVERAIGMNMKLLRAVVSRYNSPSDMWEYAADYVVWTHNRTVDSVRDRDKTPEERCMGVMPDLSGARPFDAPCWYFVYRDERKTTGAVLKPRVRYGRMVGYSKQTPGAYLVMEKHRQVLVRPQVYCKEYPGLLGLENIDPAAEPVGRDGMHTTDKQLSHNRRQGRDPILMKRAVGFKGGESDDDSDSSKDREGIGFTRDDWEPTYERPQTRQEAKRQEST